MRERGGVPLLRRIAHRHAYDLDADTGATLHVGGVVVEHPGHGRAYVATPQHADAEDIAHGEPILSAVRRIPARGGERNGLADRHGQ